MKTLFTSYLLLYIIATNFIGCDQLDHARDHQKQASAQTQTEEESNTTQLLEPLRAPVGTSFAEDLITYDIGDSNASADSNASTASQHRASSYEDDKGSDEESSGEDTGHEKAGDDNNDNNDSDDGDSNNNDDNSSTTTNSQSLADYRRSGGINLSLNAKNYEFTIVYDKFHRIPDPLFTKQLDGTYLIKLTGYVLLSDEIIRQDGVFSLEIRVPSLNIDNQAFPISSNTLTNSATTESVNALVTLKQATEGAKIYLNIVVPQFYVHNRSGNRIYTATFSVGLETN